MNDSHDVHVLLVEDNPVDVLLAKDALEPQQQFDIAIAERLDQASVLLTQRPFNVVLLDLGLPDSQGLDTLLRLRRGNTDVPVVVMTARDDEALALRAVREGAQDYLVKTQVQDGMLARAIHYAIERKRAEAELTKAKETAEAANRAKDEFLAMLAHELRNPLAAVGSAAQLLGMVNTEDDLGWAKGVIERQVRHLGRLVDDLLDASRITRGRITLRIETFNISQAVDGAVASVRPLIDERSHELNVSLPERPLWIDADLLRLEQILVNLLTNAAKYTNPGGLIWFSAAYEGASAVIRVRDNGVGIAPEALPRMFELFAQGDRSLARSEGGLGIGLTLAKKLVELHGGTIVGRSDGPGTGSEFILTLPGVNEAPPAAGDRQEAPRSGKRGARVLIVEDNVDTATSTSKFLGRLGHDVMAVLDGPSAIEAARHRPPEFVLLDLGLPGMDGYQVADRLRQEQCCKGTVIIAVSGYGQEEDRQRSSTAGIDHHFVKPVDYDALLSLFGG